MFKAPFSFKGRIRRTEYCLSFIIYILGLMSSFITYEIIDLVGINMEKIIHTYILLGSFWLNLAQSVKRSHDRGNSGWFIIIPFYTIWLFFAKGKSDRNRYGLNPKNK